MKIIDIHAHMDILEPLNWFDTPDKLINLMDEANIEAAAVMPYLNYPGPDKNSIDKLVESASKYSERLLCFPRLDPWYGERTLEALENANEKYDIRGVKLHPAHYTLHPYGELTVNLVKKAGDLNLPVLFHCGDEMMCLPLQIGELAKQCPQTTIILAHLGGYFHNQDVLTVAKKYKNIYIDTSEIPYVKYIEEFVKELGADRVIFGTDAPCCDPIVEIEKVKLADLTQRQFKKVFYENAKEILKLN